MNKKLLIGIIVAFTLVVSLGLTYAYFSAGIDIRNQHNEVVTTGTLELTYVDGPEIIDNSIDPGWTTTKTVSIENTGSFSTYYSMNWSSINNTIERNELVMSSTCTGTDCKAMEEETVGNTPGPFINGIKIEPGVTHTYTFTFEFIETGSEQNYNQGKIFSGVLNVAQSVETFTLKGKLLDSSDNPISNAQVTLHSQPQTTTTDTNGNFTFENVEVGNHTIEAVNGSSIEILDDEISFNSGGNFNISGTTVTKETSKNEVNLIIKLGGSNNINNIIPVYTLLEKMDLASAQSDAAIVFSLTNDGIGNDADGTKITIATPNSNGQGLYYTSDLTKTENGERVYYYRGVVENNYVVFAGFCWRIVRTNEDGSIKLRYGGVLTGTSGNYTCPQTGTNVGINNNAEVKYNQTDRDNTYVGYMMGLNGSGTSTSSNAQTNIYDSNIKSVIDAWYRDNLATQETNVTSKISDTIYCNDRSVGNSRTVSGIVFSSNAYAQNNVLYGPIVRLGTGGPNGTSWSDVDASPQYKCPNLSRDGFTLSVENGGTTGYGNNKLTYPVGLLTADEVAYAGSVYAKDNTTYYLYTNSYYWTMSPAYELDGYANVFAIRPSGYTGGYIVSNPYNIYRAIPAISLINNVRVLKGTGEYNSPYEIE